MENRVVVSLVIIQFAFCCLTGFCFGFAGGSGSSSDPYQIASQADLEAVTNFPAAHYILVNDIDLSSTTYDEAVISPNEASYWSSSYAKALPLPAALTGLDTKYQGSQ
ncbi:hypothetical protein L21SP3_02079 [Sedimentisphaera cyanobacteriorum]|uniref:Uncharacterized protein n=1 Tax=Sedimentisphaera cyanobacteriorum TaxID=1940790 RepID=A0A1Q2HSE6_9BACT|nr:hypothetical protein [Sedimentisphaera cyanobacteriorum]AQQ10251.1 hypothetical protein L21SP3_02079 [Sedimentisphaera cyanobacteriorum]